MGKRIHIIKISLYHLHGDKFYEREFTSQAPHWHLEVQDWIYRMRTLYKCDWRWTDRFEEI